MLPIHLPSQEVAAAAKSAHYSQCHRWLALGSCMHPPGTCLFAHDADFKGRVDLVPNCNLPQDTQGHCTRPHCFYKHTSNPPKKEVAATCTANSKRKEKAAKAAARNAEQAQVAAQQTLDLAELKNILSSLLTDGAQQKALLTALLAEDDEGD